MPVEDQPRIAQEALVAVTIAVKKAKRNRATLTVNIEAERIHRLFPDSNLSREYLEAEMIRLGVSDHVTMQFG